MSNPVVLLALPDHPLRQSLDLRLRRNGYNTIAPTDRAQVLRTCAAKGPDLIVLGHSDAYAWDGLVLARKLRRQDKTTPLVLISFESSENLAIEALRTGVNDYYRLPFSVESFLGGLRRCLDGRSKTPRPSRPSPTAGAPGLKNGAAMVGKSATISQVKNYIRKAAITDSNVLITGETGTGKELVADLIHRNSPRAKRELVCINCAAIPDSLLESELFGYEKGAFTGAYTFKKGMLRQAEGGTVFLDEIGDMSTYAQAKLLRVIDGKTVQPLGSSKTLRLNVRIVTATNCDLEQLISEDKFRRDLYFRLAVSRVHLPPLRDRIEDLPALIEHYVDEFNRGFHAAVRGLTDEAMDCLLQYDWPGNVRELKHLLEAIFINQPGKWISSKEFPEHFQKSIGAARQLPWSERQRLISALLSTNWNVSRTAEILHLSRMTLYRRMKKYEISRDPERKSRRL